MSTEATGTVRVWVTDVWDAVELPVTPGHTFAQVKAASLEEATGRSVDPSDYAIKFRGAVVPDESGTLDAAGVPNGAPMIVVPARRRPVR
jgi:hypothetical protein